MRTFTEAIRICCKDKVFNWKDRAPRSEYWWYVLFNSIMSQLLSFLLLIPVAGPIISFIALLFLSWCNFLVTIRRLHDTNRSGWWLLGIIIPMGVLVVVIVIGFFDPSYETATNIIIGICALFILGIGVTVFIFTLLSGTVGPNRYGADPLEGDRLREAQFRATMAQPAQHSFNPNQPNYNANMQNGYAPNGFHPQAPQQGYAPASGQNYAFNPNFNPAPNNGMKGVNGSNPYNPQDFEAMQNNGPYDPYTVYAQQQAMQQQQQNFGNMPNQHDPMQDNPMPMQGNMPPMPPYGQQGQIMQGGMPSQMPMPPQGAVTSNFNPAQANTPYQTPYAQNMQTSGQVQPNAAQAPAQQTAQQQTNTPFVQQYNYEDKTAHRVDEQNKA